MKNNKKIIVIILCVIGLILIGLFVFLFLNKKTDDRTMEDESPYLFATYKNDEGNVCITFYDDGDYSLFDCDSEPTNYPFDNENECTYKYDKEASEMSFNCAKSVHNKPNVSIKINNWTYDELIFTYEDKKESLKRDYEKLDGEVIEHILTLDKCYVNGKNKICLNSDGTFEYKVCDKKCKKYRGVGDQVENSILFYNESVIGEDGTVKENSDIYEGNVTADNEVTIKNKVYKIEK